MSYDFHLRLDVHSPGALYRAALKFAVQEDGLPEDEATDMLGPEDNPNIAACLATLLDPGYLDGCSIDFHHVEKAE